MVWRHTFAFAWFSHSRAVSRVTGWHHVTAIRTAVVVHYCQPAMRSCHRN
jgi:hypothetical protein